MTNLIEIVQQDVFAFLGINEELLFNERDFQMHLATWLRNSANAYDDVDVEYYVSLIRFPISSLCCAVAMIPK